MQKLLTVLGILIGIAILGGVALTIIGTRFDYESQTYANRLIPKILNTWNVEALFEAASPEFKATVTRKEAEAMFYGLSKALGTPKEIGEATGGTSIWLSLRGGLVVTSNYRSEVLFPEITMIAYMQLVKREGRWWIVKFSVDSKKEDRSIPLRRPFHLPGCGLPASDDH